jgi:hypothetical protein
MQIEIDKLAEKQISQSEQYVIAKINMGFKNCFAPTGQGPSTETLFLPTFRPYGPKMSQEICLTN